MYSKIATHSARINYRKYTAYKKLYVTVPETKRHQHNGSGNYNLTRCILASYPDMLICSGYISRFCSCDCPSSRQLPLTIFKVR